MAKASHTFSDRSGARLIQSVWAPLKEVHDARAAEVALRNAQQPLLEVPASVLPALTDAVAAEVPELTPDEAAARAGAMLRETLEARSAAREAQVAEAQAAIEQTAQAAQDCARVTKTAA